MSRRAASTALRTASDTSLALPDREANLALAVAHRDERVEREPAAALHDLGHAVDRDHVLDQIAAISTLAAGVAAARPTARRDRLPRGRRRAHHAQAHGHPRRRDRHDHGRRHHHHHRDHGRHRRHRRHRRRRRRRRRRGAARGAGADAGTDVVLTSDCGFSFCSMLELQTALAGAVGHRLHAAVVLVSRTVEHDAADSGGLRLLGDRLAHLRPNARPSCPR